MRNEGEERLCVLGPGGRTEDLTWSVDSVQTTAEVCGAACSARFRDYSTY